MVGNNSRARRAAYLVPAYPDEHVIYIYIDATLTCLASSMHSLAEPCFHVAVKRIANCIHAESLLLFWSLLGFGRSRLQYLLNSAIAQFTLFSHASIEIYIASCGPVIVAVVVIDSNTDAIDYFHHGNVYVFKICT